MTLPTDLHARLRNAFIAESMAAQRFTYFAQNAEIEGYVDAGQLFSQLAESSACAAHGHLDFLVDLADPATDRPIGETQLNLASAVVGELRDATERYPDLAGLAHEAGVADLASWFETLSALKRSRTGRLDAALAALSSVGVVERVQ
jgi:rubrerythrin